MFSSFHCTWALRKRRRPKGVLHTLLFFSFVHGRGAEIYSVAQGFAFLLRGWLVRFMALFSGYPSVIGPLRESGCQLYFFSLGSIKSCLFRVDALPQTETISTASSDCYHVFCFSRLKSERSPVCIFSIVSYGRAVHDLHGMARGNVRAAFNELHMRMELHTCDWLHVAA